jgi:hypothetical protein
MHAPEVAEAEAVDRGGEVHRGGVEGDRGGRVAACR